MPDGGGDPSKNPRVQAAIVDQNGLSPASYLNNVPFLAVDGETGMFEMLDIYLIFNGDPTPLENQPVTVEVRVNDSTGQVRCGELGVLVGEL